MKTKTLEKIVCAVVAAMMVMTLVPAPAYAKTRSVSVSPADYSYGYPPLNRKQIYKGTTKVTLRKGSGVVYFRPQKKGTYTFRISNLMAKKGTFSSCGFTVHNKSGKSMYTEMSSRLKYWKGASSSEYGFMLKMAGKKIGSWPSYMYSERPQKSMTAKFVLKKGEVLSIHFFKPQDVALRTKQYTEKAKVTVKTS